MRTDENNTPSEKEKVLSSEEFEMVRRRYEELDDDRSKIPPPYQKEDSKLVKLVKKNKLWSAIIIVLALAVIASVVFLCAFAAASRDEKLTGDYLFIFGKEEVKYKNESIVIEDVLYVDMNRLASYAGLSNSGSSSTMKYIASEGQYIKFTNESEYAVINGTKVVIPAPAFIDETKCIVPFSVIEDAVATGLDIQIGEKNTVTITKKSYTQKDAIIYEDITFTSAPFRAVSAITDTAGVNFEYSDDISAYMKHIIPSDPSAYLLLVNSSNPLSESYVPKGLYKLPSDITALGESYFLCEDAALSLVAMMKTLEKYDVYVTSAYRDYAYQQNVFESYVKKYTDMGYSRAEAEAEVRKTSATPGTSEHQSGLCVDFMTNTMSSLSNDFESSAAFRWLSENAYKYGFILRYPKDKTDITGYDYESWHFRYVGRDAATKIYFSGLCLEEYIELI